MIKTLPAALAALTFASTSFAADFKLPEDKPTCTITFPDDWKPEAYTDPVDGVSGQTEDAAVFMCAECVDTKNVGDDMEQGMKWFKKNGVTVDQSSLKTDDKFIVNGIDGVLFSWTGKDNDGPCIIQMAVMPTQGDKGILVEYWASPDAEKQYSATVAQIMHSIKPTPASSPDTADK
jgi:hypothetical protein